LEVKKEMKKKILIAGFFATIMLIVPFTAVAGPSSLSAEEGTTKEESKQDTIPLTTTLQGGDNPLGWVGNGIGHITNIWNHLEPLLIAASLSIEEAKLIWELIKDFRDWDNLQEFIDYIWDFIAMVTGLIPTIQAILGAIEEIPLLVEAVDSTTAWLGTSPWTKPVAVHGTVSDESGPLVAIVSCNEASDHTGDDGYYSLDVAAERSFIPSIYEVTASAEEYDPQTKSTGWLFPEGSITVDFSFGSDDDSGSSSSSASASSEVGGYTDGILIGMSGTAEGLGAT